MKILFLTDLWKPFPGGAEAYVFNMAVALCERGHDISIVTSYERAVAGRPDFNLIQELDLGKRENQAQRADTLHRHVDEIHPDVIITHRYFAEEYGSAITSWGYPVIEVVHQHKKIPNAQFYVYNTEYTRRQNGAENYPNSIVILPPVGRDSYADYGHEIGTMIGFVKPLPGKGIDFIYELADRLPDRKFLILRGEWQPLETIVDKPNVEFIDPVPIMFDFYKRCRIVLMPSLSEDAGTVPLEAAYNRIPCISSNIMGLPETNAGGILLSLDANQWIDAIKQLDDGGYYCAVRERQAKYAFGIKWAEKFDYLSETLEKL